MTNIIKGSIVGIINIIPGISGGTALVFLGIYDKTTKSISSLFSFRELNYKKKKDELIFLIQLIIGFLIGIIFFAKVITYLLTNFFIQTIFWFIGLIIFSLPYIMKKEMKGLKLSKLSFLIGIIIIAIVFFLASDTRAHPITDFTTFINIPHIIDMIIIGMLTGFLTIIPGISGSMVLLILGKYSVLLYYVAELTTLRTDVLLSIFFLVIGGLLGLIVGARVITSLLMKYRANTMSLIIGLILMSSIILIPLNVNYDTSTIGSSLLAFLFGGSLILISEIFKTKKGS